MPPCPKKALSLVCLISASALPAAQSLAPTNSTYAYQSTPIQWAAGTSATPTQVQGGLLPLIDGTSDFPTAGLNGTAVIPRTSDDSSRVNASDIVFVQCDPTVPDASLILQTAITHNPVAIVLFSNTSSHCNFTVGNFISSNFHHLYSTTGSGDEAKLDPIFKSAGVSPVNILIARQTTFKNMSSQNSSSSQAQNSPGGPSPSTAVAMIILYSITGVITALFLIIIITGAIRAHRHPERYGPRNATGRPRQSRARGLGRAILDTIPIVKFGEKEHEKPGDVELAGSAGAADTISRGEAEAPAQDTIMTGADHGSSETSAEEAPQSTENFTPPAEDSTVEETQGCSICTEDFEKGQDVRVLPCNHSFHPACIDPWLLNVSGTCPLCRIDLRPASPRNSEALDGSEAGSSFRRPSFAPPLDTEFDDATGGGSGSGASSQQRSSRRISAFLDILNRRGMENASAQERIAALRRLREQRRHASAEEEAEMRRRRRLTLRLQDTFHIRTRPRGTDSPRNTIVGAPLPPAPAPAAGSGSAAASREGSPPRASDRGQGSVHEG